MSGREDGQRGFLITGREEFLEKYYTGEQGKLPEFFARLRGIVAQRGRENELSDKIDQLEELAAEWAAKAAEPEIAARREMNENPETMKDVAALLQRGTGKDLVDKIRAELDGFIAIEESLSTQRFADATQTATRTRRTAIGLLLVAVVAGLGIGFLTSRSIVSPYS